MTKFIKKLYFDINFSWPKVIIYAVILGVTCGLIMMCHALDNTSLHRFGETPEAWLFFGLFICTNSKKPWESALKLFVFFLISQPLVYLTMWPEYQRFPWEYYIYWLYWTVACLPMGFLAWYIKKGNALSVVIVIAACIVELLFGLSFLRNTIQSFPRDLFAMLFCFVQVPLYIWVFLPQKNQRLITAAASAVVAVILAVFVVFTGPDSTLGMGYNNADQCTFTIADESIVEVTEVTDSSITLHAKAYGSTTLTITDASGQTTEHPVTVEQNGSIVVSGLANS